MKIAFITKIIWIRYSISFLIVLSLGIIAAFKTVDTIKYLMICRKDSLGYVDFIRGKYSILDKQYLQNILIEKRYWLFWKWNCSNH